MSGWIVKAAQMPPGGEKPTPIYCAVSIAQLKRHKAIIPWSANAATVFCNKKRAEEALILIGLDGGAQFGHRLIQV